MTTQQADEGDVPGANSTQTDWADVFGQPIHVVTRKQLIEDGSLIDVSELGREAGFRVSVAVTREVWADCVEWSDEDSRRQTHQDQDGRLWDVLFMAKTCAVNNRRAQSALFALYRVPRGGTGHTASLTHLKLVLSADDDGKPCFTILEPDQD